MDNDMQFSIDNLASDPKFNFLNTVLQNDDENDSWESPYDNLTNNSVYCDELSYYANYKNCNDFSMMTLNIQSLPSKFNEFNEFVSMLNLNHCSPDVICLQELWQFPDTVDFSINDYHPLIYKLRHNNVQGGGVGIYVKKSLKFSLLPGKSLFVDRIFESVFVDIDVNHSTKITIGSIYRPGAAHPTLTSGEQFSQFLDLFSNLCNELLLSGRQIYMLGDFNINVLDYGVVQSCTDYIDLLFSFGFIQLVVNPTRCTPSSATLIDHVITNNCPSSADSVILLTKISDHFPVIHFKRTCKTTIQPKKIEFRDFSQDNLMQFGDSLRSINWDFVSNSYNTQEAYNYFSDTFLNLYNIFFPVKVVKFNRNKHCIEPWMSRGLLTSRKEKIRLLKLSVKNPNVVNIDKFKLYRNLYNKLIKAAKKMYYEKQFIKHQSNLKKTWSLIHEAIKKTCSKSEVFNEITVNNSVINDPLTMANSFNDFFTSVASKIADDILPTDRPPDLVELQPDSPLFKFGNEPVTSDEIIECFKTLQKKKTPDATGLSVQFVSKFAMTISNPLKHIFNLSLSSGEIPVQFKIAKVIPIFKSGDKSLMDNYRPISLLNVFSKVLEKLVHNRLTIFLENNKLISNSQYGFRKNHSTIHPLVKFLNFITEAFNNKEHCLAIFCDMRKAFDTVDHDILLTKLHNLGIQGTELNWFKNYLKGRQQFVFINGTSSNLREILLGVPQGSILGPLLFILYINDLPKISKFFTSLFADDTKLLAKHKDPKSLCEFVNAEFHKVTTFFRAHKLSMHTCKTKFMVFSTSHMVRNLDFSIVLNNNNFGLNDLNLIFPLQQVKSNSDVSAIKFLGFYMDENLNFKHHIQYISKKLSSALYFIRSAKHFLTQKSLKALYYSLFHCHIIYAIHIWSCSAESNYKDLVLKQKNAIRLICAAPYNAHTEPLFKKQGILPLKDLILYFKLQFMQQYVQGYLPETFTGEWLTALEIAEEDELPNLRNRNYDDFIIPFARLTLTERFPLTSFPKTWNSFTEFDIKFLRNKLEFNSKLKLYLLNRLDENYKCDRLLCHFCHFAS
jgi:Reverse transcriptase (RNA-dependent DNA polymerase)/Endonuclease/Exonuclease/phosphatase family